MADKQKTRNQPLAPEVVDARVRRWLELVPRTLPDRPTKLTRRESRGLLSDVTARYGGTLGRAALPELEDRVRGILAWGEEHHDPARGQFVTFGRALVQRAEREFLAKYSQATLTREKRDEMHRDAALTGNPGLVGYLRYADDMLRRLQRAGMFTWAPGFKKGSPEACAEFRAGARERLIDVVQRDKSFKRFEKVGVEATFVIFSRYRSWLRKRRRVFEVLEPETVAFKVTPEDIAVAQDRVEAFRKFIVRAGKRLKDHRLRFWLEAMLADLDEYAALNLARLARRVGRNRSSAVRAFASIASAFRAQRAEEGCELF
jgi:hypothetical protein